MLGAPSSLRKTETAVSGFEGLTISLTHLRDIKSRARIGPAGPGLGRPCHLVKGEGKRQSEFDMEMQSSDVSGRNTRLKRGALDRKCRAPQLRDSSKLAYGSEDLLKAARDLSQSQQRTVPPNITAAHDLAQLPSCRGPTTRSGKRI